MADRFCWSMTARAIIGIITDTDLSRKAVAKGLDPNTTVVLSCMSKSVVTIEDSEPLMEALRLMKRRHPASTGYGRRHHYRRVVGWRSTARLPEDAGIVVAMLLYPNRRRESAAGLCGP